MVVEEADDEVSEEGEGVDRVRVRERGRRREEDAGVVEEEAARVERLRGFRLGITGWRAGPPEARDRSVINLSVQRIRAR